MKTMADYDSLAKYYRLLYADWEESAARQSKAIGALLAEHGVLPGESVLDCSCGIGTQALGLASLGYQMSCSDPSGRALAELKREARRRRLALRARMCAFADLGRAFNAPFAAVISCDNSIPHILAPEAVIAAAREMHGILRENGILLISTRDYDRILPERPVSTDIVHHDNGRGPRMTFQTWAWDRERPEYDFELFLLLKKKQEWKTISMAGRYRAYTRTELTGAFQTAGFSRCAWLMPEEAGYFQPIMIAHKEG
jgi:glycine/sarcosine N-methyltransferase